MFNFSLLNPIHWSRLLTDVADWAAAVCDSDAGTQLGIISIDVAGQSEWCNDIKDLCCIQQKRMGPKTDPCGTWNKNIISIERLPLNKTRCMDLSVRHDRIQVRVIPPRPKLDCSFDSKMSWSTQSKAAPGVLTRPTWHKAKAKAEARYSRNTNHYIGTNCHKWSKISASVLTK